MTDAEYEAQRTRILRSFYRWRRVLGFVPWSCTVEYAREGIRSEREDDPTFVCLGKCRADWRYLRLTIEVNVPGVADLTDESLDRLLIHEFCHALVHELREVRADWLDHEERVCTQLTSAIAWAINYGRDSEAVEQHVEEMMRDGIADEKGKVTL